MRKSIFALASAMACLFLMTSGSRGLSAQAEPSATAAPQGFRA